jgi:hypothetical protein
MAALFEVLVLTFGLAYRYEIDRDQTSGSLANKRISNSAFTRPSCKRSQ